METSNNFATTSCKLSPELIKKSVDDTKDIWERYMSRFPLIMPYVCVFPIDVIMNYKSTIVKWSDGTETHVTIKDGEHPDREKAVMYCIIKKMCGNLSILDKCRKVYKNEIEDKAFEIAVERYMAKVHTELKGNKKKIEKFDSSNFDETKEFKEFYKTVLKDYSENIEKF